jgi:hypothetical protein
MPMPDEIDNPPARACELVGRFLYHFSRLETDLNAAVAKLFKLDEASADIVTANIDFARKLYIVRSAVHEQNASPHEKWLTSEIKEAFDGVLAMNTERQIVAHSSFGSHPEGGVVFTRTTAREKLARSEVVWGEDKFAKFFKRMQELEQELDKVLRHIEPYVPKFDFSDPRNSGYLAIL